MKLLLRLILFTVTIIAANTSVFAYDIEMDGIYYNIISNDKVEVASIKDKNYAGSIIIPETVSNPFTEFTVSSIGDRAFSNCEGLTSVTFGDSVESIGSYAFEGCKGLTSIIFGNSLKSIGGEAFTNCEKLESVIFPSSLRTIGGNAFNSCDKLKSVTLNEGLVSIRSGAFRYCGWFKDFVIPESVREIGKYVFFMTKVTNLYLPASLAYIIHGPAKIA